MAYPQPPQPPPGYPQQAPGYPPPASPPLAGPLPPTPAPPPRRTRTKPPTHSDIPIPDKLANRMNGTVKATLILVWVVVGLSLINAALPSIVAGEFTPIIGAIIFASGAMLLAGGGYLLTRRLNWGRLVVAGFLFLYMPAAIASIILGVVDETLTFIEVVTIFVQLGATAMTVGLLLSSNVALWSKPGVSPHSTKPFPAKEVALANDPITTPLRTRDVAAVENPATMSLRIGKSGAQTSVPPVQQPPSAATEPPTQSLAPTNPAADLKAPTASPQPPWAPNS